MDRLDSGGTASNSSCSLDQDLNFDKTDLTASAAAAAKNCVYTFSDNCDSDEDDLKYKNKLNTHTKSLSEQLKHQQRQFLLDNNATTGSAESCSESDHQMPRETMPSPSNQNDDTTGSINDDSKINQPIIADDGNDDDKPIINPSIAIDNPIDIAPAQSVRVRRIANGSIPKSGKPMSYAMERKANSRSASKVRGRPKRKALVAMYQSQITDNQIGIKLKLKLKKSSSASSSPQRTTTTTKTAATKTKTTTATIEPRGSSTDTTATASSNRRAAKTNNRKRSKKPRRTSDSEDSDYKKRRRKERVNNNSLKKGDSVDDTTVDEPQEQSPWGCGLPENILFQVFQIAVRQENSLPTLVRLGKVCSLWHKVSLSRSLWSNVDFASWTKDRNELVLKWLIDNRLGPTCEDVNLANWKVTNVQCVLEKLCETCPNLIGISLAGWKSVSSDHLQYLSEEFKSLRRIDLSSISVRAKMEMHPSKSAVGLQTLCTSIQTMGERLTHLYLAHNRLTGIPQIVTALSTYSPNLVLLDLSNVSTVATSHGVLHVEKLQQGCQKLKVLRITNSHITLSTATLQEQMDSPGFPDLEELSVASLAAESRLINDECLQRILKTSTKLQLLDIRGCARLTHDSLIRLPTWDLKHLFISGCSITRDVGSGLELIASKWAHSLIECDLAWANVQTPLDNAIRALAEKGFESPLHHLSLCGSSVSVEAVKEILINCPQLNSINLSSCRGLPRGVKRLMQGATEIQELREALGCKLKTPPDHVTTAI